MWAMLRIIDKELAREEKKMQAKKDRVVANARKKMGADRKQPSILESIRGSERQTGASRVSCGPDASQGELDKRSAMEGGGGVNTLTGSRSNNVLCEDQDVLCLMSENLATEANVVSNIECGTECGDMDSGSKEESSSFEAKPNIVEPAVQARSEELLQIQKSKSNPKFDLYAVPGGKFNLKWSKKEFSTRKSAILVRQSVSQKPAVRKICGENIDESRMFNKIPARHK